jgi:hypothetical protein
MGITDAHGHVTHPELFKQLPMPPALGDVDGIADRDRRGILEGHAQKLFRL